MGAKLIRSAYSTILREARDGSAGLMDRHGNVGGAGRADPDATRADRHATLLRLPQAPSRSKRCKKATS